MNVMEESLQKHREWKGKIEVCSRAKVNNAKDLTLAYTPGVAQPCLEIQKDPDLSYELTRRANLVAVITDGSAVLGLGNIGGLAGMPVMEGKCALFKEFADVDAFPLCIKSNDVDEIVNTIAMLSDSFGGINLEDIAAPRCFEIEAKLKEKVDIPVFHDDQHGTAIVVGAALMNACKVANKKISDIGIGNLIMVDREGIICEGDNYLNEAHAEMAKVTNKNKLHGSLADALKGADAFVGVSKPKLVTAEMVKSMNDKPILFAMANPTPAFIVGTGRSDFPNQINNVIAFPGIFKGALAVRASDINEEMKMAAAKAIAGCVPEDKLNAEFILPNSFDRSVPVAVAEAVAKAARETGVARI